MFGSGEVFFRRRRENGRLVGARVVFHFKPMIGLMRGQVLEAELLVEFPDFQVKTLDILVSLALFLFSFSLLLSFHSDLLRIDLIGGSDDVIDGFVVLGNYPAFLVVGGLLNE